MTTDQPQLSLNADSLVWQHLVTGSVVTPFDPEDRSSVVTARRLKLTATDWPLEPVDRVATSRSILSALTAVKGTERLVIQVVLGPRRQPMLPPAEPQGNQSAASKVWHGLLPDRRPNARQALTRKLGQHGFSAVIRIGVEAGTAERRKSLLLGLAAAIGTVESAGVHFKLTDEKAQKINGPKAAWSILTPAQPLSVPELSHLVAWPVSDKDERFPGQPPLHPKPVRPTPALLTGERVIATSNAPGMKQAALGYGVTDSTRHTWLLGPSGVGKSTILLNLIIQDLEAGRPVVVIEPKDLVADILCHIPEKRKKDVVVLDALDDAPVGINPLDGNHRGDRKPEVVADVMFSMFSALYGDTLSAAKSPRSADILRNSLRAIARRDDASLAMLPMLLTNERFRRELTRDVIKDDVLDAGWFWGQFEAQSDDAKAHVIAPLSNKLRPLLAKNLRAVVAQRHPKFNVRQALTENKVLLVPLQKGPIGPELAELLSAIVLAELAQAIRERAAVPEEQRTPVMVYVDEVQEFLKFSTDLDEALATFRSLKCAYHLAHQHTAQLKPYMLEAFKNNARNKICFQLQPGDARDMATGQSVLSPEDFTQLPAHHVYASLIRENSVQPWTSGETVAPPEEKTSEPEEIKRLSRERYGTPREEIEAGFMELLEAVTESEATDVPRRRRRSA